MNVNDVRTAAEDLVESSTASPVEGVHVIGKYGAERIDGFDVKEVNDFAGVFVLDSSGNPTVSSRVVRELEEEIEQLREAISWGISCGECTNQLAEDWELSEGGRFLCRECIEEGAEQ